MPPCSSYLSKRKWSYFELLAPVGKAVAIWRGDAPRQHLQSKCFLGTKLLISLMEIKKKYPSFFLLPSFKENLSILGLVFYVKTIQIWIQKWSWIFGIWDKIRTFGTNIFWETPVFYSITNSVVCCMTMPLKLTFTKELKMPKDEKVDNSESHGERKLNCWELISSLTPEIHQKNFSFLEWIYDLRGSRT